MWGVFEDDIYVVGLTMLSPSGLAGPEMIHKARVLTVQMFICIIKLVTVGGEATE